MDIEALKKTMVFKDMSVSDISSALHMLSAREKAYEEGESIFLAGDKTENMGLVLAGSVIVESSDMWGNRTILSLISKGQFFAESYAVLKNESMLVDVTANEDCKILFIEVGKLFLLKSDKYPWAVKIIGNILRIAATKNIKLSNRAFHTSHKTIRARIMAYLNSVSLKKGNSEFDIPFDRQQLADYLNVERSALSKELGKMQREGLIFVKKNHFVLKDIS